MARQVHMIVSLMPEYDPVRPKLLTHGAFTNLETAEKFRDKVNEDLTDDEEHAFVLSRYFSFLKPEDFEDKTCFEVKMVQGQDGRIADESIEVAGCAVLDTDSTVSWLQDEETGDWTATWRGWAISPTEAAKRAKVRAIALRPVV